MPVLPGPSTHTVTIRNLIKSSLRLIGAIAQGTNPVASEMADGLEALNAMCDSWNTERLVVPSITHQNFALVGGQADYTYGPGGDFDAERPAKIEFASVTVSGQTYSYPNFREFNDAEWEQIPDKTISGIPACFHVDHTTPTMTVSFYPVPDQAYTFTPYVWKAISEFALGDTIVLPNGYHRALRYGLAIELAPEYGKEPSASIIGTYTLAKAAIKRLNQPKVDMKSDTALQQRGGSGYTNRAAFIGGY